MSLQDSPAALCVNMFIQTSLSSCQTHSPSEGFLSVLIFSHYKGEHSTSKRGLVLSYLILCPYPFLYATCMQVLFSF